ncbi:sigma-70 family RNA polymerase sigma factor [Methylobacterium sp. J-090]|uniref:sigma-70 family RNA polymerase sigma factor n=1 Tax=Methylobacterium sp. J-090 TaxID=2836666 RepID=UPI001FBB8917|nr:sigma-70 family RNA polymerase sigma factor [Methylobacterium sp. J-090]MCJ2082032.1 sigma-70 family RNA polymerase sigma factor [Methylobacterium sp. J-090]
MAVRATALSGEVSLSAAMQAAQAGDAAAYRDLLRDCVPVISAMARARGVQGAALDDVVQDTLLTVHRARATYDPARPFLPWLRAIAQRRAIDALRRKGRRPQEVHDPLAYEARADPGPLPGDDAERRARATVLAAAVAHLPDGQREAIEHIALRELSLEEASTLTGRTKGALKVNFHRGLKALRVSLSSRKEDTDV